MGCTPPQPYADLEPPLFPSITCPRHCSILPSNPIAWAATGPRAMTSSTLCGGWKCVAWQNVAASCWALPIRLVRHRTVDPHETSDPCSLARPTKDDLISYPSGPSNGPGSTGWVLYLPTPVRSTTCCPLTSYSLTSPCSTNTLLPSAYLSGTQCWLLL